MSEEELADYQASRLYNLTFRQLVASLAVLTVAAAIVILPFIYMLIISFKGPAEVGNGRLLPDEIRSYMTNETVWIEVALPALEALEVSQIPSVPARPANVYAPPQAGEMPEGAVSAHRLGTGKGKDGVQDLTLLYEAQNPDGLFDAQPQVEVFLPADDQQWQAVAGQVRPRTLGTIGLRLLDNYKRLLNWDMMMEGTWSDWLKSGYPRWYFNSLFVAITTVLLGVFLDSLAAFGFAKFQFPFKKSLFAILIATLMIPYPVTLVPTFFVFAKLGFYNTYLALIIPGVVSAFGIFLVRQYMETIPDDMLDAARVDGANDFQVYRKVVLPAARPVLAALAIFRFVFQWNTYLYPLVLTNKDSMKTVQLGIATMEDMHNTVDYGLQMAGSVMAVLPILVVYIFLQKHFIAGITMGSSKG